MSDSLLNDIPPFVVADHIPDDRPVITAAVVPFTERGEVVMFRHRNGSLDFLGGHIDAGESIAQGVRREAWEEGGVGLAARLLLVGYLVFGGERPSYNPLYAGAVEEFVPVPAGTESAGRLVFGRHEVIEAIGAEPDHPWKARHVEMMERALATAGRG